MLVTLTYEPMRLTDLEMVVAIEQVCFGGYWSRQILQEEIQQPAQRLWTLRYQGEVIAYSGLWRVLEEAHLTTLAVAPQWRRQHLGELLLWLALDRCQRENAHWLTLEVRPSNQVALQLYQKYQLVEIGRRKRYYPDGEDALVMWCPQLQQPTAHRLLGDRACELFSQLKAQGISLARVPSPSVLG